MAINRGGLNRYDGYQVLEVSGPDGMLDKVQVNHIYQDSQHGVWIATGLSGLLRYDPRKDEYRTYIAAPSSEDEFFNNLVYRVLSKDAEHMWIVRTNDIAVLNIDSGELSKEVSLPLDEESGFIRAVKQHGDILFIATSERLYGYHLPSKTLREIEHIEALEHPFQSNAKSLFLLDDDTLLLGTVQGLYELDISALRQDFSADVSYQTRLTSLNVWKMLREGPNTLLLGTDKGLCIITLTTTVWCVISAYPTVFSYLLIPVLLILFVMVMKACGWPPKKMVLFICLIAP